MLLLLRDTTHGMAGSMLLLRDTTHGMAGSISSSSKPEPLSSKPDIDVRLLNQKFIGSLSLSLLKIRVKLDQTIAPNFTILFSFANTEMRI